MTTVTTTIPDDTAGKIKRNAESAIKSASSYVVVLVSALAAVWLGLTDAQQQAFIAAHPILTPLGPYLAVIAWLIARLAPQNVVLSADKEALRVQAIDWLHRLLAANAPGQVVSVPASVAKALGLSVPVVVVPPLPVDTLPQPAPVMPAPGADTQHVELDIPAAAPDRVTVASAAPQSAAVAQVSATLSDTWSTLAQRHPTKTADEIAAMVQAALEQATMPPKPEAPVTPPAGPLPASVIVTAP